MKKQENTPLDQNSYSEIQEGLHSPDFSIWQQINISAYNIDIK